MSNDYYLVHIETHFLPSWGKRVAKSGEELARERERCIHGVSGAKAAEVAAAVRDGLNDELRRGDYGPVFKAVSAGVLKLSQAARFDANVLALAGGWGRTDSDNPASRDAEYHSKALKFEVAVRKRLGLSSVEVAAPRTSALPERTEARSSEKPKPDELPPSWVRARAAYDLAMETLEGAASLPLRELLPKIRDHLRSTKDVARSEDQKAKLQAMLDSLPSNPETFARYLRQTGIKKYSTTGERINRQSNIKRSDQI
ncbi:MAG: hypothetical protein IID41_01665 [Planctomycetes bacterium]|nr:hypothetical protein [Planctomycetota bacterium]